MEELVYDQFGVKIFKIAGRLYVEYDVGEIAIDLRRSEVSNDEANEIMKGENAAYNVLIRKARDAI